MSLSNKLDRPIDSDDGELAVFLGDLQGNILKGHGRDHTVNCFLRFDGDAATVGPAVSGLARGGFVTSAAAQLANTAAVRAGGPRDIPVAFFFLTATGYAKLGVDPSQRPDEEAFLQGMAARADRINDTPEDWEPDFQRAIDALLIVGRDAVSDNDTKGAEAGAIAHADFLLAALAAGGVVENHRLVGRARRNGAEEGIEHFGYVDGRSQPLLLKADVKQERDEDGVDRWNPAFNPLKTVLVPDKAGTHGAASFGSYLVLRKLEQNVNAFKRGERALARALGLDDPDPAKDKSELAGAMVVGRFEDGTPLISAQESEGGSVRNNFNYDSDPDGQICPFHAHIRKTNPRGDVRRRLKGSNDNGDRRPIMARRGITYGDRTDDPNDNQIDTKPEHGNGLIFMAYQRSLEEQFEFTQQRWADNPAFVNDLSTGAPLTGLDPVIGQSAPGAPDPDPARDYKWPLATDPQQVQPFKQHVTMLGGAYFFAPSISAIRSFGQAVSPVVAQVETVSTK